MIVYETLGYLNISECILIYLTGLSKKQIAFSSPGWLVSESWKWQLGSNFDFLENPLLRILVFNFLVGSHFGFLRLLFFSRCGCPLLDGLVFFRNPFSKKSPVQTSACNVQGDLKIPSGKHAKYYGKSRFLMGKITNFLCPWVQVLKLQTSLPEGEYAFFTSI